MKDLMGWMCGLIAALFIISGIGWMINIFWTFHQHDFINVMLGIVGAIVAPIGVVHGWWILL